MSALGEFLEHKRAAWLSLQARPTEELQPVELAAHVVAEGRSGVRRIRIRDFQIVADSGENMAGHDLGPSSPESQLGVLASCLVHTFLIQAADRQVPLDALDVIVTATMDPRSTLPGHEHIPRYPHNITYRAVVESAASDAELEKLQLLVEAACPILHLLRQPQSIAGRVEHTRVDASFADPSVPGLPQYLEEKGRKISANQARLLHEGGAPRQLEARASAQGRSGVRRIRIREFQQLSDSGPEFAGYNLGPTSPELQTGVLASCLTHVFLIQAASRGIPLTSLQTRVSGVLDPRSGRAGHELTPRHPLGLTYVVDVESPASSEAIAALHLAVEEACPVFNLLLGQQTITGTIENLRVRIEVAA